MNTIIESYHLKIKDLGSAENKVVNDIFCVDAILNDIAHFSQKRKTELFKKKMKKTYSKHHTETV